MNLFSTLDPAVSRHNKLLVETCLVNANAEDKASITLLPNFSLSKIRIGHIFFALKALFLIKKKYKLRYRSYDVGTYVISWAYRSNKSWQSQVSYFRRYLIGIFRACYAVDFGLKSLNAGLDCAILDNAPYINGIFYEIFSNHKIPIYSVYEYPFSFIKINFNNRVGFHDVNNIRKFPEDSEFIQDGIKALEGRMEVFKKNHSNIDGYDSLQLTNFHYQYVIYVHAFTDAQHQFGYDGTFENTLEWLKFTLNALRNKKVCVKAHPDFFREWQSEVALWDLNQTKKIEEEYLGAYPNCTWITSPMANLDFLRSIDKRAIVVSHHGNAVIEAALHGFKSICSQKSPYSRYEISNYWGSLSEYESLLRADFEVLKYANQNELGMLGYRLVASSESYYNNNGYYQTLCRILGVDFSQMETKPDSCYKQQLSYSTELPQTLSKTIVNLNL
jgi:hypothetical protein